MKINGFSLYLGFFLCVVVISSLFYPFRYVKYLLPVMPLLFAFTTEKVHVAPKVVKYFLTFLLFYGVVIIYLFIQNVFFLEVSARFIPNATFIITPLLFIFFLLPYYDPNKMRTYVLMILFVNIGVFLYEESDGLLHVVSNFGLLKEALISSEIDTENNLAYVFGFMVLFFLFEKYNKWFLIIASFFFILCFKRIVIVAVLLCIIVYFIVSWFKINLYRHRIFLTLLGLALNIGFIQFAYLITSGKFDQYILEKTGYNADRFLMGRKTLYTNAFSTGGDMFDLSGLGLGKIDDAMFNYYGVAFNLHSEVIKNYFEFGLFFFIAWIFLLFYKTSFSNKTVVMLVYFNVLILTDNVFIYFEIMFYFYFFILYYLHRNMKPTQNE